LFGFRVTRKGWNQDHRMKKLTTFGSILALLATAWCVPSRPACQTLARMIQSDSDNGLAGLFSTSSQEIGVSQYSTGWLQATVPTTDGPAALEPYRRYEKSRSVEEFAAKIWYAGALLLTADRLVRSMDSVLARTRIQGTRGQYLGIDTSRRGVGLVIKLGAEF